MPTTEVGILGALDGDLYVALGEPVRGEPGVWTVRLYHNPIVQFIFAGMLMMGFGALSLVALRAGARGAPMSWLAMIFAAAIAPAALGDPAQETRALALEREIRCVQCENEPIAQSTAEIAADMRAHARADRRRRHRCGDQAILPRAIR